jgi:FtsH-binding integral membrane protein
VAALLVNTVSTSGQPLAERSAERTTPTSGEKQRDRLRQGLNLLLSITQFAAAIITFSGEFGDQLFYSNTREPLIVPASYAFSVWGVIFPASIAYGIYQALPQQRENALLRRIGWWTAFAFGCISLWSPVTLLDPLRYTVPLFFGALGGLIYALYQISQQRTLTRAERWLVAAPIGVYAAWCTVGTIANTSTSLFGLGYTDPIFAEQTWAIVMLLVAGLITSFMTTVSRGNLGYALTIIWAFVGIVVANVVDHPNTPVAITAGSMAALLAVVLVRARTTHRS